MATKRQKIEVGVFLVAAFSLLAVVLVFLAGYRRKPNIRIDICLNNLHCE